MNFSRMLTNVGKRNGEILRHINFDKKEVDNLLQEITAKMTVYKSALHFLDETEI